MASAALGFLLLVAAVLFAFSPTNSMWWRVWLRLRKALFAAVLVTLVVWFVVGGGHG